MEKRNFLNYCSFVLIGILLVACQKDEPINSEKEIINQFSLAGDAYLIEHAYLEEWQSNLVDAYCFDVYLTSQEIEYDPNEEDYRGVGDFIFFDFETAGPTGIDPGIYRFSNEGGPFTFVDGELGIQYDFDDFDSEAVKVTGGEVQVSYEGNEMHLKFSVSLRNGQEVQGVYEGAVVKVQ